MAMENCRELNATSRLPDWTLEPLLRKGDLGTLLWPYRVRMYWRTLSVRRTYSFPQLTIL